MTTTPTPTRDYMLFWMGLLKAFSGSLSGLVLVAVPLVWFLFVERDLLGVVLAVLALTFGWLVDTVENDEHEPKLIAACIVLTVLAWLWVFVCLLR